MLNKDKLERFAMHTEFVCLQSIRDFLNYFKLNRGDTVDLLEVVIAEGPKFVRNLRNRKRLEEEQKALEKSGKKFTELQPLRTPVGGCPKCGSMMFGMQIQKCETKKSGRAFYKECGACTYYVEIFTNKGNKKFIEVEGG